MIWSRHGDHGTGWYKAMATIKTAQNHRLILEVIADEGTDSFVVLDDFKFSEEACGMKTLHILVSYTKILEEFICINSLCR